MAYADFKDINRRTIADEVLSDQASDIVNNAKCDGYQRGVALMAYNLKKKKKLLVNYTESCKELYKSIIKKIEKRKVNHLL